MNYSKRCACCGHQVTAYTLPFNEGLARAFLTFASKFIAAQKGGTESIGLRKGQLGLENAQYSNFQNLAHFGLITQKETGREWFLTERGLMFYLGNVAIDTPAAHMGGQTLDDTHPAWGTHDGARRMVTIREVAPDGWKDRIAFQAEKCL